MNEGNSSRFVFRYGTAVTVMGQVFTSLAKSLIGSESQVVCVVPCVLCVCRVYSAYTSG